MKAKRKIVNIVALASPMTLLMPLSFIKTDIPTQNYFAKQKSINENNAYVEAKVDPIFPVKTVRKTGSDKNKINLLFLGDGYLASDPADQYANHVYNNIINPWFGLLPIGNNIGVINPYQTYLNDKFNVYAIQPPSSFNSLSEWKSFFEMYKKNSFLEATAISRIKTNALIQDLNNNFLETDGLIRQNFAAITYSNGDGRANAVSGTLPIMTITDSLRTNQHEFSHSLFNLDDEYDPKNASRDNCSANNNPDTIKWKEFLNFRSVEIRKYPGYKYWIPTSNACIMNSYGNNEFCEVCQHTMIKMVVKTLEDELFYIADPQLTPEHWTWDKNEYTEKNLLNLELYDFNVTQANNKKLEFRSVISNLTSKTRKIKLRIVIKNQQAQEKFKEESNVYTINPNDLKGVVLITKNIINNVVQGDSIIGEIYDIETNEVLATSRDRRNKEFAFNNEHANQDIGKRLYKIQINFLDNETKQPLDNIYPTTIVQRDGTIYPLEKILFNGYKLVDSSVKSPTIKIDGQNYEINYYYQKLKAKKVNLNLYDDNVNKNLLKQKQLTIFEGQKFLPRSSDFYLWDLNDLRSDPIDWTNPSTNNKQWTLSIKPPQKELTYDFLVDDNTTLAYYLESRAAINFQAKDHVINQGQPLNDISSRQMVWAYDYDGSLFKDTDPKIVFNNINYNVPGKYQITYLLDGYLNDFQIDRHQTKTINVIVKPSNQPSQFPPNDIKVEKWRLDSYNHLTSNQLINNYISSDQFNNLNQNNLLSIISNLSLDHQNFQYQVVNFQKPSNGSLYVSFKIRIANNLGSIETNEFTWHFRTIYAQNLAQQLLMDERNRLANLNFQIRQDSLLNPQHINANNLLLYLDKWIDNEFVKHQVIDFVKANNQIKFKVKFSFQDQSEISKEIIIPFTNPIPPQNSPWFINYQEQSVFKYGNPQQLASKTTIEQIKIKVIEQFEQIFKISGTLPSDYDRLNNLVVDNIVPNDDLQLLTFNLQLNNANHQGDSLPIKKITFEGFLKPTIQPPQPPTPEQPQWTISLDKDSFAVNENQLASSMKVDQIKQLVVDNFDQIFSINGQLPSDYNIVQFIRISDLQPNDQLQSVTFKIIYKDQHNDFTKTFTLTGFLKPTSQPEQEVQLSKNNLILILSIIIPIVVVSLLITTIIIYFKKKNR